ncbi:protein of unknown function [Hymenobacter daecheongensis DSM 21074]|uniref:DUF4907 domain-containing protein n=1 Tax=Hymenobacter daecheongensis DSM 21074 TaxID=1121955 RepID=A0A1M5ZZD9_9BACT|nr:DUF4907 domain-containing protein [Hymenobacter daecheongensis]SHI29273.1 protein of unknown function [Hymenobacter daecheongensis DSM 21074]
MLYPRYALAQPLRTLLVIASLTALAACSSTPAEAPAATPASAAVTTTPAATPPARATPAADFTSETFANADGSFGYRIRQRGRPFIEQPNVPGRPGVRGFATAAQARQVADLVQAKLGRGQMPPSVTEAELDSLGL